MKKLLNFLIVGICIAEVANADMKDDFSMCANIKDSASRLSCFDMASHKHKLKSKKIKTQSIEKKDIGKWRISSNTNPIDDSTTVILKLDPVYTPEKSLIIRCKSNKTELYAIWDDFIGIDSTTVTSRIAKNPAESKTWSISTDRKATFYPGSPITHIKQMFGKEKYLLQTTPYGESPVTTVYNIKGLENAIIPLRETCNW